MRKPLSHSVLVVCMVLMACGEKQQIPDRINFITDYDQAKTMAGESGKSMIIGFYTDWAPWCDSLDANTYSDSLVISLSSDNIFVKIDADIDTALANQFGINGYPTVVITKPDGDEIDRIWGYLPPIEFYNQVQLYLQGKETLDDYLLRLEDEPRNLEYLSMIGEKYSNKAMYDEAISYFEEVVELDSVNEADYAARAMASMHDAQARAGDYKSALKTCMRLLKMYPDSPESDEAAALLGFYTAETGDKTEALKLYRGYLKMNPESENAVWVKQRVEELEAEKR
jgi:tetratricopeptide (TPR) repeat protein